MTEQTRYEIERPSRFERLIGGRPAAVALRLLVLSLVVGFFMSVFGLEVQDFVRGAVEMVQAALRDGAGIFERVAAYVVTGAALVVPLWLIMRVLKAR